MTKSPVVPDPKPGGGSRSLQELSHRLLGFGDDAKAASLAIAARSALRTIPLLERLSWDRPLRKKMQAALGRTRMPNSAIVLGREKSFSAPARARRRTLGGLDRLVRGVACRRRRTLGERRNRPCFPAERA